MKKITLLFILFATLTVSSQTFTGATGAIPDSNCDVTNEFSVTVTGVGILGASNSFSEAIINITHTYDADLDITLIAPDATAVELSTDNGGSGDNYTGTHFRDDAVTSITAGSAPFTGNFLPEGDLSTLNGVNADGTWILRVCDDAGGDVGTVDGWSITFIPTPTDTPGWYNIQWLDDGVTGSNTSLTVDAWTFITAYAQVWEAGVTDAAGQGAGIECWFGGNDENTDPSTWPADSWEVATYNGDAGSNDEYMLNKEMDFSGTVYVAARWRLNGGPYVYGGYNGPWDGTTNNSIELIVNPLVANDNCDGAIALTVNADLACGVVTPGTIALATDSGVNNCGGTEDDDVWYSFVATSTSHVVDLTNIAGSTTDLYHAVYDATPGCGALAAALTCSDPNTSTTSGLTIGVTYYVQVYSWTATSGQTTTFDICVGTPPPPPANDDCANATPYTTAFTMPVEGACVGTPNILDLSAATDDIGNDDPSCDGFGNYGVWYTWTATSTGLTFTSGTGLPGLAVYEAGACGTLVQVGCLNNASGSITGLTVSNNYILFIWDDTEGTTVDFCLEEYTPPAPPANDDCANATGVISLPYNEVVDATSATNNAGFVSCDGSAVMNDGVWYTFTTINGGTVDIVITGVTGWDPEVRLFSGSCGTFTCVANADSGGVGGSEAIAGATVAAGTQYWINIAHWSGSTDSSEGPFTIDISTSDTTTLPVSEYVFENFKYFPNPVNDNLNLRAQSNIQNVSIYNMLGQEVSRISPNAISSDVDMSALQTGVYFVNVTINDTTETIRIIKQ
ncbi:MAG: T9SS type A sorting domain-containing protein [Flavobacteriaceae bacterium]|nr:T9SS type A sorting domain-containing protein [Flavobacteriaceae bacterium]